MGRESLRAFCAGVLLASVFALAFFLSGGVQHPPRTERNPSPSAGGNGFASPDASPFQTGAILFMPFVGNDCRQHLFDNFSGRIWFFGYVDCGVAIARGGGSGPMIWSAARVDAIRGGFRKE